ncbi:hypothetical protein TorRG33x02_288360 [Trema orientale]|uniref:Uncharacterized protein n=1 Tax=Trema orientale TaxID=63057 RepID=A0A2P5CE60_TREOI|nr:hypothetical protein TorRG33x02_288360 [Trema orientale]
MAATVKAPIWDAHQHLQFEVKSLLLILFYYSAANLSRAISKEFSICSCALRRL